MDAIQHIITNAKEKKRNEILNHFKHCCKLSANIKSNSASIESKSNYFNQLALLDVSKEEQKHYNTYIIEVIDAYETHLLNEIVLKMKL